MSVVQGVLRGGAATAGPAPIMASPPTARSSSCGNSDDRTKFSLGGSAGREESVSAPADVRRPRISPDGRGLRSGWSDQENDIWIWDFARETLTRFTFDPLLDNFPLWTPDGSRFSLAPTGTGGGMFFGRQRTGRGRPSANDGEAPKNRVPYAISPDGAFVVIREDAADSTMHDLLVLSLRGTARSSRSYRPLRRSERRSLARWSMVGLRVRTSPGSTRCMCGRFQM